MNIVRNDGTSKDNIVQNRFAAYLKVSIAHQKAKYLAGIDELQKREISYEGTEIAAQIPGALEHTDRYFEDEISDQYLCQALEKLKERDRTVVLKRAVSGESFLEIATDIGIPYVNVKAIYRRSLEKLRKEMRKNEFY